jgi:hypothetical protein
VLLVYISLALGCAIMAVCSDFIGRLSKNPKKEEFAAQCIQIATGNFGIGFLFGVVPTLSIYLSYTQFLYGQHTPVTEYFLWAAFFNLVGLLFLNKYREAFHVKKFVNEGAGAQDVLDHAHTAASYSGVAGVTFLLMGSYFFIGGSAIAVDPGLWQYGFGVIYSSIQVWLKYAAFLCGAVGLGGAAAIFFFQSWNGGIKHISEETRESEVLGVITLDIVFIQQEYTTICGFNWLAFVVYSAWRFYLKRNHLFRYINHDFIFCLAYGLLFVGA